jgi:hypothetical protein
MKRIDESTTVLPEGIVTASSVSLPAAKMNGACKHAHYALLTVAPISGTEDERKAAEAKRCSEIADLLKLRHTDQVTCWGYGAQEFFQKRLSLEALTQIFPQEDTLFVEMAAAEPPEKAPLIVDASPSDPLSKATLVDSGNGSARLDDDHQAKAIQIDPETTPGPDRLERPTGQGPLPCADDEEHGVRERPSFIF